MPRLLRHAELGPTIVFLASDALSFMTGAVVTIDGGQSLTLRATLEERIRKQTEPPETFPALAPLYQKRDVDRLA